jgi:preprotein translocase subunit SecG
MYALLITLHILVCLALIGVVLLQQGKGADMGAAFGGSSQTLFGSSGGATLLGKLTSAAAVVFMLTSLGLTYNAANRYKTSVMPDQPAAAAPAETAQPAETPPPAPEPPATQPETQPKAQ